MVFANLLILRGNEVVMTKNILVYGTESETIKNLISILKHERIYRYLAEDRQELFDLLGSEDVYLVILEMDGGQKELLDELQLISQIRKRSIVPIIIISAEKSEYVKIQSFQAGADDYIQTDCCPLELLARIIAQLNRYIQLSSIHSNTDNIYHIGELIVDDGDRKVIVNGRSVDLTPIEYKILRLLVQEQGKTLSVTQIYESIWHMKAVGANNTVSTHICNIRKKIEDNAQDPQYLKVVWGIGYKVG